MSVNGGNPHEDAEIEECDGEKVLTMMDVLQEQEDFEEDANAVLGASDDKNCTYSKGHIKRQAVYVCMTCCPDAKSDPLKRAGVCLACCLTCHENHELVELYTKRNFRCDCGNPKFNSHPCQFTPDKPDLNEENSYNHNFSGVYCICNRPYPDPESQVEEEMIQCIVCEDWLHTTHLDATVPINNQYSEMICKACMERNKFLHDYSSLAVNVENIDVDVLTNSKEANKSILCNGTTDVTTSMSVKSDIEMNENNEAKSTTDNEMEIKTEEQIAKVKETTTEMNTEVSENPIVKCSIINRDHNNDKPQSSEQVPEELTNGAPGDVTDSKAAQNSESNVPNDSELEEYNFPGNNIKANTENVGTTEMEKSVTGNVEKPKQTKGEHKSDENKISEQSAKENEISDKISNQEQSEEDLLLDNPVKAKVISEDSETIQQESSTNEQTTNPTAKDEDMDTSESGNIINNTLTENLDKEKSQNETEPVPVNNDSKQNSENREENDAINSESKEQEVESLSEVVNKGTEETKPTEITENSEKPQIKEVTSESTTEAANTSINEEKDITTTSNTELSDEADKALDTQKRKHSTEMDGEDSSIKKPKLEDTEPCVRPREVKKVYQGATFWPSNFRHKLCTCNECMSMYKDLSVLFLIDPEDTVSAYETLGKEKANGKPASQYEKGLEALSSLGRIQQINALTEYNNMRDKLLDFLKSFKDRREVVKEEDIKAFFAGMKPKREPDGVYFCR